MTRRGKLILGAAGVALLGLAGAAWAQGGVSAAVAAGQVGERADGYLGVRGQVSDAVKAEVEQINIKRRALYTSRAAERGVAVEAIAAATACQAMQRVGVGQAYNLGGGWAVRGAGDPAPKPANCP
ncbi:DUF1318 domain-containing protein [Sphingomonas sp. MAH-20]|uniref:DUF1318 domain-containing protein n=1 Tax=Sphingomonas horti TaxID=2682842 RepID=A0A6I4J4E5_9SPHN|nr:MULTISPECIES: DUF1318 domain-containing protein [Sphingomonas]MBA2919872.1 DUF1318 domain-containing protein [Sphingomonas sp. CGMCC 1.13658]MVO78111.1 DUF1318 domain-containing protein [Sphingomonas horti]